VLGAAPYRARCSQLTGELAWMSHGGCGPAGNDVEQAAGVEHLVAEGAEAGVDEQVRVANRVVEIRHL